MKPARAYLLETHVFLPGSSEDGGIFYSQFLQD